MFLHLLLLCLHLLHHLRIPKWKCFIGLFTLLLDPDTNLVSIRNLVLDQQFSGDSHYYTPNS